MSKKRVATTTAAAATPAPIQTIRLEKRPLSVLILSFLEGVSNRETGHVLSGCAAVLARVCIDNNPSTREREKSWLRQKLRLGAGGILAATVDTRSPGGSSLGIVFRPSNRRRRSSNSARA